MRKIMVCALAVVGVACMGGVASATLPVRAKAVVQKNNANCGNSTGTAKIGVVNYKRIGNAVELVYKLTAGEPRAPYEVSLWNASAGACENLGTIASFTTTAKGTGSAKGSINVPAGDFQFFATGLDLKTFQYNDALTTNLP